MAAVLAMVVVGHFISGMDRSFWINQQPLLIKIDIFPLRGRDIGRAFLESHCSLNEKEMRDMPGEGHGEAGKEKEMMDPLRKAAIFVGVLFIIGTVAYSFSVGFFDPILENEDYLVEGSENESKVVAGTIALLISGAAIALIPVVMYPILRRHNGTLALGYVVFRVLEAGTYVIMAIIVLMLLSVSQDYVDAGAPADSDHETLGALLQDGYEWTDMVIIIIFTLGALIFYYMLYVTRLVPEWLSLWGLVGAALWLFTGMAGMFGAVSPGDTMGMLMALPIAANEMVLAAWLIIKGFNQQESGSTSDP